MPPTPTDLSDTSTWLPLDGLAPGFDANKAAHCAELDGREITLTDERGTRIAQRFTADTVSWEYHPGRGDDMAACSGEDAYEAFEVDTGLVYAQFQHEHRPHEAVSLVLDLAAGRALSVLSTIGEPASHRTRVRQRFVASLIEGVDAAGRPPAPTSTLVGRRVLWQYSAEHAYEHVYLSPHWYSWHCLAGPEQGLADTDESTAYELRPGIYLFAWREKVIPCASVTVADHRDLHRMRSHGVLFGLDESGEVPTHFTFGAHGRLLGTTAYPPTLDPAR